MRIVAIEPTVFFVHADGALNQLIRLTLDNDDHERIAHVEIRAGNLSGAVAIPSVAAGQGVYTVSIPDIQQPGDVSFRLLARGGVLDEHTLHWQPTCHWSVYLTHYSHHDLGYTDLPSHVLAEYDGFMDDALAFCEQTADWPDDARFRYSCEQAWFVLHYLDHAPNSSVERLVHFIKSGQIEVPALFGKQILELHGHEELIRLLYPSFGLKRRYGIEITSAAHNDIPGLAWGLASVLAGAGVRYLSVGVPFWYFGEGAKQVHHLWDREAVFPLDIPAAAWWQGPDGQRVLLWSDVHGVEWQPYTLGEIERDLPSMLAELQTRGYRYDMVRYTVCGGHRDNAPPALRYAEIVRAWNQRWAYPRLINATNASFLRAFEQRWGPSLPTLRGDAPGTDYPVNAYCTPVETAVNRRAHDLMLAAERWATVASFVRGAAYPRSRLDDAYRQMFYFDEHCWGMCHVGGPAHDAHVSEKVTFAYRAHALAHDVAVKATNVLADGMALADDAWYMILFNSLGQQRSTIARIPLRTWMPCGIPMHVQPPQGEQEAPRLVAGGAIGRKLTDPPVSIVSQPFSIVDAASGEAVPFQLSKLNDPQAAQGWAAECTALSHVDHRHAWDIVLDAKDLPAVGYRAYRLIASAAWPYPSASHSVRIDDWLTVDSRFYRIKMDRRNGVIASLFDKELGRDLVDGTAPHGCGRLIARQCASGIEELDHVSEAFVGEDGPLFTTIRLRSSLSSCPRCTREITVFHTVKRVDISAGILRDTTPNVELFMAFPFAVPSPRFRFEAAGSIMEPIVDQLPGSNTDYYGVQHWADIHNEEWGIAWAPLDTAMAEFGGLWPGYVSAAHHGATGPGYGHPFLKPGELTRSHLYALLSYNNFSTNFVNAHAGQILARYAITSHRGNWREGEASQFGWNAAIRR